MIHWASSTERFPEFPTPTSSEEHHFPYDWSGQSRRMPYAPELPTVFAKPGPVFEVDLTAPMSAAEAVAGVLQTLQRPPIIVDPDKLLEAEQDSV